MLTASIICPHCNKSDLGTFTELQECGDSPFTSETLARKVQESEEAMAKSGVSTNALPKGAAPRPIYDEFLKAVSIVFCQNCFNPIMAVFQATRVEIANHNKQIKKISTGAANRRLTMDELALYPSPKKLSTHPSWPSRVQKLMPDIEVMIQKSFDPSISISTSRTVLDICMKSLEGKGKNIYSRIEDLQQKGVITTPISEWAHKVRALGNDATHDAEGTQEDAKQLFSFLQFFLKAAYELDYEMKNAVSSPETTEGS